MPRDETTPPPWPTEWRSDRAPCFPVTTTTTRDETGIDYCVLVSDGNPSAFEEGEANMCVWSTRRDFSQRPECRAGGPAFQYAAREQERIAAEWVAAIEKADTDAR
jgi:hypothetical protein